MITRSWEMPIPRCASLHIDNISYSPRLGCQCTLIYSVRILFNSLQLQQATNSGRQADCLHAWWRLMNDLALVQVTAKRQATK